MEHVENFTANELQLVVTARKIRQFKEIIAQQHALGAAEDYLKPSKMMLDRLEREFQMLSNTLLAVA